MFDWVDFLDQRVQVITIRVADDADAFQIFETLNDRGLDLTIVDLLKNYLLGLGKEDIDQLQKDWIEIIDAFATGRDERTVTAFIRHYWSSLYGPVRERDLYRSLKRRVRSDIQAAELVRELQRSAPNYAALLDSTHYRWRELEIASSVVETLLRLELEQNRPLLLAVMDHFSSHELRRLLRYLISWSVRGLFVGGIGGGTTERYYSLAAVAVRKGQSRSAESVFSDLEAIVASDEVFRTAVAQRRLLRPALARYYLLGFNNFYSGSDESAIVSDEVFASFGIDYVLPRRASESDWPGFRGESIRQNTLRLGNQVLVQKNIKLPSGGWSVRRQALLESGIKLNQTVAEFEEWTPAAISEIQARMADAACKIWPLRPNEHGSI